MDGLLYEMSAEWSRILKGGRVMNIAFAVLFTILALLSAWATALYWHNNLEIDKYLSAQGK
jgi:predicted Co/Zn/Cd cation transporter (cation efflux family)